MLSKYKNDAEFRQLGEAVVNEFVAHQSLSLATRAFNNAWWKQSRYYYRQLAKTNRSMMNSQHWKRFNTSYVYQLRDLLSGKKRNPPEMAN